MSERARAVKVGPGRDAASEMGPVVTREAQQRILGLIDSGEKQGAAIAVDGRELVVPGHEDGFFVGPTVIDQVSTEMDVYTQEIFGPVLSVVRADDVDEAIALINANPYGNGTAIFTSSGEAARRFQRGVNVGMIGINVPVPVPMAFYSFGGWKDSLFGDKHVHGPEGVSFYTRAKVVTSRWPQQSQASGASLHFPTSTTDAGAADRRPGGGRPLPGAVGGAAEGRRDVREVPGRHRDQRRGRRRPARPPGRRAHQGGSGRLRRLRPRGADRLRRGRVVRRHGGRAADAGGVLRAQPAGGPAADVLPARRSPRT